MLAFFSSDLNIPLLNDKSPRCPTPVNAGVTLWPHQQAMLAHCKSIEENPAKADPIVKNKERYMFQDEIATFVSPNIGVMNDPPGSGKTYAILALIADNPKGVNLIVVPQNIYNQWKDATDLFFKNMPSINIKYLNHYGDATDFYGNAAALNKYNVVLVNDIYAEPLATAINDNHVTIERFIIDEIDSVEKRLHTPINCNQVWLVSASYTHKDQTAVGPYMIKSDEVYKIFVKCYPEFIEQSLKFEDPVLEKIVCEDNEIRLFMDLIPEEVIVGLNTDDRRLLVKLMNKTFPPLMYSMPDLAKMYADDLLARTERLEEYKTIVKNDSNDLADYEREEYVKQIANLEKMLTTSTGLKQRLTTFVQSDPSKIKPAVFKKEICKRIKSESQSKWLIFNDNASSLYLASDILKSHDIRNIMLDGGNDTAIAKAIDQYKNGNVQALLLNSKMEGAGMNLENTSHLLFMHKTDPRLVEQVVGRAQRFGRKGALTIIMLYNRNEN
jgi:hypothetical protein